MPDDNIYQAPQADLESGVMSDPKVRLWFPQAKMMAEKGQSVVTIKHFFKGTSGN